MSVASRIETEERIIIPPLGDKNAAPSYRQQRIEALRRRKVHYLGNGIDLIYNNDPTNLLAARYKEASFRHLALRENGLMVGSGIIDQYFTDQRLVETGRPDTLHFEIIRLNEKNGLYILVGAGESKSGKIDLAGVYEVLGKNSAFFERTRQKKEDLLLLLQNITPGRMPYPTQLEINPTSEISMNILCNEKIPGIDEEILEIEDPKGRFKKVVYEHFSLED